MLRLVGAIALLTLATSALALAHARRAGGCARHPAALGVSLDVLDERGATRGAEITRVAAAAERCTIAVARGDAILVSDDDGGSFRPALDGEGALQGLAATVDGALFALRATGRLGVRDPDGAERWARAPDGASALATSGAYLGVFAGRQLVLSDRGGRGWARVALPDADGAVTPIFQVDGDTLRVLVAGRLFVGRVDGGAPWVPLWTAPGPLASAAFGGDGWLYAHVGEDESERLTLIAVSPRGEVRVLRRTDAEIAVWPHTVAGNGVAVLAHDADAFSLLRGGRVVSTFFAGEGCAGPAEQSPWPRFILGAVDRHGLPLVALRARRDVLVRVPGCERERALVVP